MMTAGISRQLSYTVTSTSLSLAGLWVMKIMVELMWTKSMKVGDMMTWWLRLSEKKSDSHTGNPTSRYQHLG